MEYTYGINDDYLDDDDDGIMYSTRNYRSDSEEENLSVFMTSKPQKKKCLKGRKSVADNDEDEFEKDMAIELRARMKKITTADGTSTSNAEEPEAASAPSYYDSIYFDSDKSDSDGESGAPTQGKRKPKHRVLSNDELLYDPLMDDVDQAWVDNNRRSYQMRSKKSNKKGGGRPEPLPQSDAVLNCPACFTTLCLDCQRHEIYQNQYRAMFVFNCSVDKSELLHFAIKQDKKKKFNKKNKRPKVNEAEAPTGTDVNMDSAQQNETLNSAQENLSFHNDDASNDEFNPVKCEICNTKVAVQDKSEVYHFFNVLTSY